MKPPEKHSEKREKATTYWNPKHKLGEGPVFTFGLPGGGAVHTAAPRKLRHWLRAFQTRTATSSFAWFTRNNRYDSANLLLSMTLLSALANRHIEIHENSFEDSGGYHLELWSVEWPYILLPCVVRYNTAKLTKTCWTFQHKVNANNKA